MLEGKDTTCGLQWNCTTMCHGNPTRQLDRFNTAHQVSRAMSAQSKILPRMLDDQGAK